MRHAVFLASIFVLTPLLASAQAPIGSEFQVNTYTPLAQYYPAVAADAAGNFVVVWESQGQDGSHLGAFGQRFSPQGHRIGAEFRVNTHTTGAQRHVSVASDPAGNVIVTWAGYSQDGSEYGIFAQRFDATGASRGLEFRVNTYTTGSQVGPRVAVDATGDFVVVWRGATRQDGSGYGIFGRRFDTAGTPLGSEFRVNSYTTSYQVGAALYSDPAGNFVVAWTSFPNQDGSLDGVFAQRFDASGARRGGEFRVNTYTTGKQSAPSVAGDAAGNFVIVWHSKYQDGSYYGVFGQRYDASGAPLGAEFRVNTYTTDWQWHPAVAADAAGKFVVVWIDRFVNPDVHAQRYDAFGVAQGSELRVSTSSNVTSRGGPAAALWRGGSSVVVWTENSDGSYYGVFGQCYGGLLPAALAVDSSASNGSDGNGILEPGESTVAVEPSWRNATDSPFTLMGTATSFAGPPASGVVYDLTDAAASYGTLGSGSTGRCIDCYAVGVFFGGTRPFLHWDARLVERADALVTDGTQEWTLHVGATFSDVPASSLYYRDIETLVHKGVTGGCASTEYCPGSAVSREQMTVFTLEAREGAGYRPPPCAMAPLFEDVPPSSFFCPWIEELAVRGVVSGCGGGNFCPQAAVTREQMPVFVLRLLDPTLDPPACTAPRFADVPANSPYCRWIEELARRGVVGGCGGGNYCPTAPVTREQMATFLTGTYGLTLYGP